MTPQFNDWWNADKLTDINPYRKDSPAYWAWEGWCAGVAAERNKVAHWMIDHSFATGHGDTTEDLLEELEWQVRESEREACAAVARQWDVDHPASNYGGCIANAIRARGQA